MIDYGEDSDQVNRKHRARIMGALDRGSCQLPNSTESRVCDYLQSFLIGYSGPMIGYREFIEVAS